MANWHLVFAYDSRATDWLADRGFPHPPARPGNRMPTSEEVRSAAAAVGTGADAPLLIDHEDGPITSVFAAA